MSIWSDDLIRQLTVLHQRGFSFSEIAQQLGCGLSRNAVIGKAKRLGLDHRGSNPTKAVTKPKIRFVTPPAPAPEPLPAIILGNGAHVTVTTLVYSMCRWPIGDPRETDFHFCGHPRQGDLPYCDAHALIAYQPKPQPRTKAVIGDPDYEVAKTALRTSGILRALG